MPIDLQKKRERDKRYRENQKQSNEASFLARRREICRKSYHKKVDSFSSRDRRQFKKKKAESNRKYRDSKRQEIHRSEHVLSPKAISAFLREKKKKKVELNTLRVKYRQLQQYTWRLHYKIRKERNRAAKSTCTPATTISSQSIKKSVQTTLASSTRTRAALLAHFALMETMSSQQNWTLWEKRYIALRVQQVFDLAVTIL